MCVLFLHLYNARKGFKNYLHEKKDVTAMYQIKDRIIYYILYTTLCGDKSQNMF